METIEDRAFENESIELDGKSFIRCSFKKCSFIYRANAPFGFDSASLSKLNGVTMEFVDGAALTIQALGQLNRVGGSFQQWVEYEMLRVGIQPSPTQHPKPARGPDVPEETSLRYKGTAAPR